MKRIICFVAKKENLPLNQLGKYNIDFFTEKITFKNLSNLLTNTKEIPLIYSDNINWLILLNVLYPNIQTNFIYSEKKHQYIIDIELDIEKLLTTSSCNNKPIYFLGKTSNTINSNYSLTYIEKIDEIISKPLNTNINISQNVFLLNNKILISEFNNFEFNLINLGNSDINSLLNNNFPFYNLDSISNKKIKNYIDFFLNYSISNAKELINIEKELNKLNEKNFKEFIILLKLYANYKIKNNMIYYFNSFIINFKYFSSTMFDSILIETKNDLSLSLFNKYFLMWQFLRLDFSFPTEKKPTYQNHWFLYKKIFNSFNKHLNSINFISKEERNDNLIIIMTGQFLNNAHAPTKLVLERAYHLIKDFNKDVIIINTCELLTSKGTLPFYKVITANKISQYSQVNQVKYKNINIPFYQPSIDMPNENEIINILSIIQEYKPYFILNVGSANLTADLSCNLLPVISFPTTSDLAISEAQIHIDCSKDRDYSSLDFINNESIIYSNLAHEGVEEKKQYKKEDFNLPKDKFLIVITGNRLDSEINEELIDLLIDIISYNSHIVFIGHFLKYDFFCNKNSCLKNNSSFLGYQKDLYSLLNLFDLFINPPRVGGGTVAYWAILNQLPIITLNYGDVNNLTNQEFSVKNIQEMKKVIINYISNKEFYNNKKIQTNKLLLKLNTVADELKQLLRDIEKNNYFK